MSVALNSIKYSPLDANANFTKYQFAHFYKYMTEFTRDYDGIDPLVSGSPGVQRTHTTLYLMYPNKVNFPAIYLRLRKYIPHPKGCPPLVV